MVIWIIPGVFMCILMIIIMIAIQKQKKHKKKRKQKKTLPKEIIIEEEEEYYNEPILVSAYTVDLSKEVEQIKKLTMKEDNIKLIEEDITII